MTMLMNGIIEKTPVDWITAVSKLKTNKKDICHFSRLVNKDISILNDSGFFSNGLPEFSRSSFVISTRQFPRVI